MIYSKLFLIINDKEIKIIEADKNDDVKKITYFCDNNEYTGVSLEYITKETLFNQICLYLKKNCFIIINGSKIF